MPLCLSCPVLFLFFWAALRHPISNRLDSKSLSLSLSHFALLMEQPVSAPSTQPEPQPEPDPLPSVEAKAQSDPLPPAPVPAPAPPVERERERPRKKRKLEEVGFHNFTYFKIRTILQNLRPSFLQVFQNPNYRETNLAGDILKDIKSVLELSKQLRSDLAGLSEPGKASSIPPRKDEGDGVLEENVANCDNNNIIGSEETVKDVPKNLEDGFKGSYVVGGSPVGWNYLVFPGSKPAYYGRSKAEKQACQIMDN